MQKCCDFESAIVAITFSGFKLSIDIFKRIKLSGSEKKYIFYVLFFTFLNVNVCIFNENIEYGSIHIISYSYKSCLRTVYSVIDTLLTINPRKKIQFYSSFDIF